MAAPDSSPSDSALTLPLSLAQHEVWLDQRLWPDSGHLHIGGCCHPQGPLDLDCLQRALALMVAESEALRLLPERSGRQRLLPRVTPPLQHIALPAQGDAEAFIERWWLEERQQRFELGRELPWRLSLLSDGRQRHALYLRFHHLVMDGWGTQRFLQRWTQIYSALLAGQPVPAYEGGAYSEHVRESLAYRDSPAFARDADYWARQWPALLPAAQAPRQRGTAAAGRLPALHLARLRISRRELDPVLQGLQARGHSLFDAAVAALCLYLHRSQGADAVAVGMPSLGRSGARWRATLGMFATVQPLLIRPQPGLRVGQLLDQVHQQVAGGLRHARYPLSETAHRLQLMRSGRDSLLDAMVSLERQSYALSFGDSPLTRASQSFGTEARYPLALTLCEFGDSEAVELVLEAADSHCGAAETALLLRRLWHLMVQLPQDLEAPLERLALLPAAEREALILGLHQDLARLERPQTFVQQLLRQARLAPQASALFWEDEPDAPQAQRLSYAQLDAISLHLARQLRERGLHSGDRVALLLPRSPALVLALLATARAGAAFLILDAESPPERLGELLTLSRARLLLCSEPCPVSSALDTLCLPLWGPWPAQTPGPQPDEAEDHSSPEGAAYMLFTSGSTGRPKGVLMGHDALQRRLAWMARRWGLSPQDRAVQQVQPAFDPALIELLLPLTQGASLALMPPGRHSPQRLAAFMARHRVSFCALVPATLQALLEGLREHPVPSLRLACCGGETLPPALSNRFLAQTGATLFNVYGPTEACIFASAWACEPWPEDQALPVGRALDDTRIYVLDSERQVLPFGVCGDIWLAGPTLAQGYLEAEDTARAFHPDPFHPDQRMYRTGDRGWLDTDGQLHFAGRQDRQIKLRGHRIELGEVEAACLTLPGVRQAAVKCLQEGPGPARLHAWLGGSAMRPAAELLAALRGRLPGYMVPAGLSLMSELPLSATGKIDLQALPAPQAPERTAGAELPGSALQARLLALWRQQLQREDIGLDDDFFEQGGDSLSALSLLGALEEALQRSLPLQWLVEHPSPRRLAAALEAPAPGSDLLLPLSEGGTPLFIAASGHGDLLRLRRLAEALQGRYALRMLQPPLDPAPASMEDLATRYAQAIARETAGRPYLLAGFSVGGVAALASCAQLEAQGQGPQRLLLLDTLYPDAALGGGSSWRLASWLVRHLHLQDLSLNGRRLGAMFSDPGLVAQVAALRRHRSSACDCPVLLVRSSGLLRWNRMLFQPWERLLGQRLSLAEVPGLHGSMFDSEHVQALAELLTKLPSVAANMADPPSQAPAQR